MEVETLEEMEKHITEIIRRIQYSVQVPMEMREAARTLAKHIRKELKEAVYLEYKDGKAKG